MLTAHASISCPVAEIAFGKDGIVFIGRHFQQQPEQKAHLLRVERAKENPVLDGFDGVLKLGDFFGLQDLAQIAPLPVFAFFAQRSA